MIDDREFLEPEPSVLVFTIRRFMYELRKALGITVALTTHTEYAFGENGEVFCDPVRDAKGTAVVPAIGLVGPTIAPNNFVYSAHQDVIPTRIRLGNLIVDGYKQLNPSVVMDLIFTVRLFHNRTTRLLGLFEAFHRYMKQNPYLVVPSDRRDKVGSTIPDHRDFINRFWTTDEDLANQGEVHNQRIPHIQPNFTSTTGSNNDNLFVAVSEVVISRVSLTDGIVVRQGQDAQEVNFGLFAFANGDPEQIIEEVDLVLEPEEESP